MTFIPPQLHARITNLLSPSTGEVVRAKRAVLRYLSARAGETTEELQWVLVDERHIPRQPEHNAKIDIAPNSDYGPIIEAHPFIEAQRLCLAARMAIAELTTEGVLTGVENPRHSTVSLPMSYGSTSGGERFHVSIPELGAGYEIARSPGPELLPLLDVDIFVADLGPLNLDDRARLCIKEALSAYRRQLYLSCISLLGSVSEGAWWRLAERFRGRSSALDDALDDDRTSAATIIRLAGEEIAKIRGHRTIAAELHSHATYLRELRNYGIHPRAAHPDASEEYAFTEVGCSLLLLATHRYLERLAALP